jgi:NAD(P)-dependent dehydrogenase (short-subunit alcohol dehydrogenase family)
MGRFTNKIVNNTGDTSGIGLAAARQFIKEAAPKHERRGDDITIRCAFGEDHRQIGEHDAGDKTTSR